MRENEHTVIVTGSSTHTSFWQVKQIKNNKHANNKINNIWVHLHMSMYIYLTYIQVFVKYNMYTFLIQKTGATLSFVYTMPSDIGNII